MRKKSKIAKIFHKDKKDIFLIFLLYFFLKEAVLLNIENIISIPEYIFLKIKHKKTFLYGKKNQIILAHKDFFGFKPEQNFRNFFKLKNISKENFEKFIELISGHPYNCNKDRINKSLEKWDEFYNEAKTWNELENFTKEQKEKLAITDTISLIYDDIVLNKNQL